MTHTDSPNRMLNHNINNRTLLIIFPYSTDNTPTPTYNNKATFPTLPLLLKYVNRIGGLSKDYASDMPAAITQTFQRFFEQYGRIRCSEFRKIITYLPKEIWCIKEKGKPWVRSASPSTVVIIITVVRNCLVNIALYRTKRKQPRLQITVAQHWKKIKHCNNSIANFRRYLLLERTTTIAVKTITIEATRAVPKEALII